MASRKAGAEEVFEPRGSTARTSTSPRASASRGVQSIRTVSRESCALSPPRSRETELLVDREASISTESASGRSVLSERPIFRSLLPRPVSGESEDLRRALFVGRRLRQISRIARSSQP
jgi:hypothetical protein